MKRRPFDVVAILCLLIVLVTLDVVWREGTVVVSLRWFQVPLLVPPVWWVLLKNKRRMEAQVREERRRAGLCGGCGYDLRASGERCPECGESRREIGT